jgi:lipoyl(octanoyl) transferase
MSEHARDELWVCQLGLVPYREALAAQERLRELRLRDELPDTLLLLEHPPVYTRGRRSAEGELPFGEDFYAAKGIEVIGTDRGGRVTYHGPGQLVGYPIMRIADVHDYLRTMEAAIVAALAGEGLQARSRHEEGIDYTGVGVQERKIASIGVHVRRGVSTHGFAINVENDLDPFTWVVACGLPDVTMTSLARELPPARAGAMSCLRRRAAFEFCRAHGRRQRLVSPRRLGIDAPSAPPPRAAVSAPALPAGSAPAAIEPREAVPA